MGTKNAIRREDLAAGACLCDHCTGKCCRYFSLPIEQPTRWRDFDRVGTYLQRGESLVYVEKGTWYLVVMTRCKYLDASNRCRIYLSRPKVCQEYTTDECEYDTDWSFDKVFDTAEQLQEYAEAVLPPRRAQAPYRDAETVAPHAGTRPQSFTIRVDSPRTWDDYDAIRWYLAHERTYVYVRQGRWRLVVTDAERANRAAAIGGETRARSEKVFETAEQLWEYAEAVLPPRLRRRRGDAQLPIISLG